MRIAVVLACRQLRLTLVEWLDEKTLKSEGMKDVVTLESPEGRRYRAAVVPDASFVIQRGETKARFFVEIDESTVTVSPSRWERRGWARKVRAYETYFNSEAYQNRYGGRPACAHRHHRQPAPAPFESGDRTRGRQQPLLVCNECGCHRR